MIQLYSEVQKVFHIIEFIFLFHCLKHPTFCCESKWRPHMYLGNACVLGSYKKTYHQFCFNYPMKIESFEIFFAILATYFHDPRLSPQIRSGPAVLKKSVIFSGISIQLLDFSYLLSTLFST